MYPIAQPSTLKLETFSSQLPLLLVRVEAAALLAWRSTQGSCRLGREGFKIF